MTLSNFSDFSVRFTTAAMPWILLIPLFCIGHFYPFVWEMGIILLASICLYEWFRMGQGKSIPFRITGAAIIGLGFWMCRFVWVTQGFVGIKLTTSKTLVLIVMVFTYLLLGPISDTAAYLGDRLIGGPKLCPALSPSKTWAGFLLAVLGVPLLAYLCSDGYIRFRTPDPEYSFLNSLVLMRDSLYTVGFIGLLCLGGQMGAVFGSWAKGVFQIKDSTAWRPGDGSILDGMYSFLGVTIMFFALKQWGFAGCYIG